MIEKVSSAATYGGSGSAVIFGLTADWVGVIGGLIVGVVGYLTKLYYDRKRDRREEEEHRARMRGLGE